MSRSAALIATAVVVTSIILLLASGSALAAGPSIDECIAAHEQSQVLIKQSKLREAKERLRVCQSETCPAVARKDCGTWFDQLERTEPTVVIVARDPAGHDLIKVRILVDGVVVADKIDGKPMPLDPGAHAIRLESEDGRSVAFDIIIINGDRSRPLVGTFEVAAKPVATPVVPTKPIEKPPADKPIEPERSSASSGGGIPTISYVLGAVALAGLASFGTFAVIGKDQESCVPNCTRGDVDDFRRSYLIADISLGVGIAAAAGALWFALSKK